MKPPVDLRRRRLLAAPVLLLPVACSRKTRPLTYTHDVQFVTAKVDQVDPRGPVDANGAVAAFRAFPYKEQQAKGRELAEPTFPTIRFRCQQDRAVLAIWSIEPDQYNVHLEVEGKSVTVPEKDASRVERFIRAFFEGKRQPLFEELSASPGAQLAPG